MNEKAEGGSQRLINFDGYYFETYGLTVFCMLFCSFSISACSSGCQYNIQAVQMNNITKHENLYSNSNNLKLLLMVELDIYCLTLTVSCDMRVIKARTLSSSP